MPDFNLERYGPKRPLLKLPPSGSLAGGGPPVEVFVELAKAEAGCYMCRRPIPAGASRVSFRVMTEVIEDPSNLVPVPVVAPTSGTVWLAPEPSPKARRQTYHVHPGCITRPMGSESIRHGTDCWDCGALGVDADRREIRADWSWCFTTHKFAWGALCDKCQKKPKWLRCGHCEVFYPRHMINFGQLPENRHYGVDEENPRQDSGDWCIHCGDRFEVMTAEQMKEARAEFEETRKQIMKGGLF